MNKENVSTLRPQLYKTRLIDKKIKEYLTIFGSISIEGPKWCGKTWTGKAHAKSEKLLDEKNIRLIADAEPKRILEGTFPVLIDEWTYIPELWDLVRRKCDEDNIKGKYILTCSTSLSQSEKKGKVFHSGAGRIAIINMHTMSLYEEGDSSGKVSLLDLKNNKQESNYDKDISLNDISYYISRGGWPGNRGAKRGQENIYPKEYVRSIVSNELNTLKSINGTKMSLILKSLSRNETTFAPMTKILSDIMEDQSNKEEREISRMTLYNYVDKLNLLHLIEDQEPYSENVRSRTRVGKVIKHHFCDVSIPSSILGFTSNTLINDMQTLGYLFESLVIHDLRIYMEYLGGKLYSFNEYSMNAEADALLEFEDGEYALVEVKLSLSGVEDAKKSLLKVRSIMTKPPIFMLVVVGISNIFYRDKETGIFIAPLTSLKP